MKGLLLLTLFVAAAFQLVAASDILVIQSLDEVEPAVQFQHENEELAKLLVTELDSAAEALGFNPAVNKSAVTTLKSKSHLESDKITLWNGGSEATFKIHQQTTVALKAIKNLGDKVQKLSGYKLPKKYCPVDDSIRCKPEYPYRTHNGVCNNLMYPFWGSRETSFKRLLKPDYEDGFDLPRVRSVVEGKLLPNARSIAMRLFEAKPTVSKYSSLLVFFGQFVDHDLSLTASASYQDGQPKRCTCESNDSDCFNIDIPEDDLANQDQKCFVFVRSSAATELKNMNCHLGQREQLNLLTSYLDLGQIYGTSSRKAQQLRLKSDGLLRTSYDPHTKFEYLPYRSSTKCRFLSPIQKCYHTGDTRSEDNNFLLFLQTLFVREHNRIARELKYTNPNWDDERLFQEARKICIGEYQHIIYNEWLPVVLGVDISQQYDLLPVEQGYSQGYNPKIRASIINEFAGAIFRFGHTLIKKNQYMADSNYRKVDDFPVDWYMFNPYIKESGNLEMCAKGMLMNHGYYFHPQVNEALNDWLFNYTFPDVESKRFSLAALNIQRGRDHGFPRYNEYRRLCGLNYAKSFRDLHNIPEYAQRILAQLYDDVNDIDLYAGAMSEYPVKDGIVGATVSCIVAKQFADLKFGDRFFYEHGEDANTRFDTAQLAEIRRSSMARLLCDHLDVDQIQELPFYRAHPKFNKFVKCSDLPVVSFLPWQAV